MLQELAPCACGMRDAAGDCGGRCGGPAFSLMFPVTAGGGQLGYGGGPVDCTLSLATPSTRRAEAGAHAKAGGGSAVASCKEPARRCANCDTSSTPLWRNGPRGPKSLCNACGIRYKKEERRAAAALAPAPTQCHGSLGPGSYACGAYARQHQPPPQWGCYGSAAGTTKSASFAAYGDSAAADGPCLSWMLNGVPSSPAFAVRERPSLFQYY